MKRNKVVTCRIRSMYADKSTGFTWFFSFFLFFFFKSDITDYLVIQTKHT